MDCCYSHADALEPPRSSRSDQVVGVLQKHAAAWLADVLREGPGLVDLEIEESVMDPATTEIGSRKRRIIAVEPMA